MSIKPRKTVLSGLLAVLVAGVLVGGCGAFLDNEARLERAQSAYDQGDYRSAMIDAKALLLDEPDNAEARLLLGRVSIRLGDGTSARKELQRAIELGIDRSAVAADLGQALLVLREFDLVLEQITPELAKDEATRLDIARIRGDALLGLNRPGEARDQYSTVLAGRADDLETILAVASSYTMEGNLIQARATIDEVIATDSEFIPAWLQSGSLWVLQGDAARAETDLSRALEMAERVGDRRQKIQALTRLIDAQLSLRNVDGASVSAAQLTELTPNSVSTLYLRARVSYAQQDWATAQNHLNQLLKRAPDFRPAQLLLGAVHLNRGNLGQAEMLLTSAVAAMPDNLDARKLLAETRLRQQRSNEASAILEPALEADAADSGLLAIAARASLATGDTDAATEYLRQRTANEPGNESLQIDLAAAHVSAGEIEQAVAILQSISGESADDVYRRDVLLVLADVKNGDLDTALASARQLRQRWPDNARVHALVGGILLLSGDNDGARESFAEAERLDPASPVGTMSLARVDLLEGKIEDAIARFETAIERHPDDTTLMISLARLQVQNDDRAAAAEWLKKAIQSDDSRPDASFMLATLHLTAREFEAAEAVARSALERFDYVADLYNVLGLSLAGQQRPQEAVGEFKKAIELSVENPLYRMNLARAYATLGQKDKVAETLERSLQRDPDHIQTNAMLARLRASEGDIDDAVSLVEQLNRRNPDSAAAKALLAEVYFRAGRADSADAVMDEALAIENTRALAVRAYQLRDGAGVADSERSLLDYLQEKPGDNGVRLLLAQEYQARGDFDRAVTAYETIAADVGSNYVVLNNLAWAYFEVGDARAEALARRAYELAPEVDAVADTLGWILVQQGSLDDGIETLEIAVERSGGNAEYVYHLAEALNKAGRTEEARALLERILAENQPFASRTAAENLLGSL